MYVSHTPKMVLLLYYYLVLWDARVRRCICECTGYYVELHLDFATRYASLTQIWKTEYTRTQLPGPPEEPVSPGQDQTVRDGNGTSGKMGICT